MALQGSKICCIQNESLPCTFKQKDQLAKLTHNNTTGKKNEPASQDAGLSPLAKIQASCYLTEKADTKN